jgi:hypothetical protein
MAHAMKRIVFRRPGGPCPPRANNQHALLTVAAGRDEVIDLGLDGADAPELNVQSTLQFE